MRPIVIIPTRLGSTRLPGKALTDINGAPMQAARDFPISRVIIEPWQTKFASWFSMAAGPASTRSR
ncbi:hypothetical protein [uncultured Bradyrhizobium sp.]|uniref:cytidylyltransferase domain-containing protein n=1 Tax=uncultured Bradyrhizobium sp. TaxID=199684 RepID=UPI002624AD13|nr:hypothetical protein [uncultured Bradyrhizobium sp.]